MGRTRLTQTTNYHKVDVIAKFQARYDFYAAQHKKDAAKLSTDPVSLTISGANKINAWKDLQFIKRGTNWRLALPHTGAYPYTEMFRQDWTTP